MSTRAERETTFKAEYRVHLRETKVRRELTDIRGRRKVFLVEVHDFSDLHWRVRYPDGDWQELNSQELKPGKELATFQPKPAT